MKPGKLDFSGELIIDMKCVRSTKYILLHSKNLNITYYWFYQLGKLNRGIDIISMKKKDEQILFEPNEKLAAGEKYRIVILFRGVFSQFGFVKQTYTTNSGEKRSVKYPYAIILC